MRDGVSASPAATPCGPASRTDVGDELTEADPPALQALARERLHCDEGPPTFADPPMPRAAAPRADDGGCEAGRGSQPRGLRWTARRRPRVAWLHRAYAAAVSARGCSAGRRIEPGGAALTVATRRSGRTPSGCTRGTGWSGASPRRSCATTSRRCRSRRRRAGRVVPMTEGASADLVHRVRRVLRRAARFRGADAAGVAGRAGVRPGLAARPVRGGSGRRRTDRLRQRPRGAGGSRARPPRSESWIDQVGVLPAWRGRGLGAHLTSRTLQALASGGAETALAHGQ